jgi:hypothetical protein
LAIPLLFYLPRELFYLFIFPFPFTLTYQFPGNNSVNSLSLSD